MCESRRATRSRPTRMTKEFFTGWMAHSEESGGWTIGKLENQRISVSGGFNVETVIR
jgi:hypothetical protein